MLKNSLKKFVLVALSILLVGCTHGVQTYNVDSKYVALISKYPLFNFRIGGEQSVVVFYDENGKILNEIDMGVDSDLSADKSLINNIAFHGPGGLILVDKKNHTVKKVTNRIVHDITEDSEGVIYYLETIGANEKQVNDPHMQNICVLNGKCIQIKNEYAYELKIIDNKIYIKTQEDLLQNNYKLKVIDRQSEEVLSTTDIGQDTLLEFKNELYLIASDRNKITKFSDNSVIYEGTEFTQVFEGKDSLFLEFEKNNNRIIQNLVTGEIVDEVEIDRNEYSLDIDTGGFLNHYYKNGYFVDVKNNKKITLPNETCYGVYVLK